MHHFRLSSMWLGHANTGDHPRWDFNESLCHYINTLGLHIFIYTTKFVSCTDKETWSPIQTGPKSKRIRNLIYNVQYEPKNVCLPGGSRQAPPESVSVCRRGLPGLCSPLRMARHLCEPTGTKGATYRYRQVRPLWPGPSNSNVYQMITIIHIVV